MTSTSLVHVPRRHEHDSRALVRVAFWLAVAAWALAALLAPRAAAAETLDDASPLVAPLEAPRLVWPWHEIYRPHCLYGRQSGVRAVRHPVNWR
jgi:hypothetical protein